MKVFRIALTSIALFAASFLLQPSHAQAERRSPLTSTMIRKAMAKHQPVVRQCYVKHAMAQKGANGNVTLEFTVRASGQIRALSVEAPSVRGKQFARCVTQVAKDWRFPASSAATRVRYPLLFVHTRARGAGPVMPARARGATP